MNKLLKIFAVVFVLSSGGVVVRPLEAFAEDNSRVIEEIVVTARLRAESAQDAPVPVNVISQAAIVDQGIESMDDLVSAVPGLVIGDTSGPAGASIYLRGIGGGETNPLSDQAIATNVDGVLAGSGQIRRAAMMDLAQVEVLRGPQALFYGKNSPGGVFSITTADPGDEFEAKFRISREVEAEEDTFEGVISGPITESLGGRLAVSYMESEGYFDIQRFSGPGIVTVDESRYPGIEELFVRGTLTWDNNNGTSIRAKITVTDAEVNAGNGAVAQRSHCPNGSPQLQPAFECRANDTIQLGGVPLDSITVDPTAFDFSPSGARENEQILGSLQIDHDLNENLTLTSITGFYDVDDAHATSFALGPVNTINSPNNSVEMEQWSQELRLLSDFDSDVNFLIAAYYEDRETTAGTSVLLFNSLYLGREVFEQDQSAYSLAGQIMWTPVENIEVSVGGRFSDEEKDRVAFINGTSVPLTYDSEDWDNFSPELTVAYYPNDEWMIYGSYKEGFKSGGFDASFGAAARDDVPYDQEEVDGFEFGAKGLMLEGTLSVNAVIYSYEYDGLQVSTFDSATTSLRVRNATSADVQGIELDFNWQTAIDGLRLSGNFVYNDTEYGQFLTQCFGGQTIAQGCNEGFNPATGAFSAQNIKGDRLVLAPEAVANLALEYEAMFANGWRLGAWINWRWTDEYDAYAGGPPQSVQDSVSTFDASVSLSNENWSIAVKGRNLSDEIKLLRTTDTPVTGSGTGTAGGMAADLAAHLTRGREVLFQLTYRL